MGKCPAETGNSATCDGHVDAKQRGAEEKIVDRSIGCAPDIDANLSRLVDEPSRLGEHLFRCGFIGEGKVLPRLWPVFVVTVDDRQVGPVEGHDDMRMPPDPEHRSNAYDDQSQGQQDNRADQPQGQQDDHAEYFSDHPETSSETSYQVSDQFEPRTYSSPRSFPHDIGEAAATGYMPRTLRTTISPAMTINLSSRFGSIVRYAGFNPPYGLSLSHQRSR